MKYRQSLCLYVRLCQTVVLKSQAQQCTINVSTQMTGIGCYVSCLNDKLVAPCSYITADEYHDRRLRAVGEHTVCVFVCFITMHAVFIFHVEFRSKVNMALSISLSHSTWKTPQTLYIPTPFRIFNYSPFSAAFISLLDSIGICQCSKPHSLFKLHAQPCSDMPLKLNI